MGPDLILAAIVAAMATHAWEHSKRRAAAEWSQARERARQRAESREKRRQGRGQRVRKRVTRARQKGPRDPLWWPYVAGWVTSASVRAGYAAVQGAREGAATGAREGYRVGRERARARRQRRERAAYANGQRSARGGDGAGSTTGRSGSRVGEPRPSADEGGGGEVPLDSCAICGVYVAADALDSNRRCRVCAEPLHRESTGSTDQPAPAPEAEVTYSNAREDKEKPVSELATINGSQAGTGEGYTDTVATLQTLARQLAAAHETAQTLVDNLTANEVDSQTINNVGELMDALDSAAPLADQTAKHVVARHEPVAEAHAAAGGSQNIATKTWYDDV